MVLPCHRILSVILSKRSAPKDPFPLFGVRKSLAEGDGSFDALHAASRHSFAQDDRERDDTAVPPKGRFVPVGFGGSKKAPYGGCAAFNNQNSEFSIRHSAFSAQNSAFFRRLESVMIMKQ